MAQVRRIVLTNVESHLRTATENAENVRRLQDEMETLLDDYSRETARFKAGEIAKDVFEDLTDQHRNKVNSINQRIAELCRGASSALRRAETEVRANITTRRAARRTRRVARRTRRARRRR